jgi:hypothetical protein
MNRRLGERACEAAFLTVLVFCWIGERINLAGCLHVSGPYRCLFNEFQENYPPSFVLPPGFFPSCAGSKFALRAIIIPCCGKKKKLAGPVF